MNRNRIQFLFALLAFLAAEAVQYMIVIGYQLIYGIILGIKAGFEKAAQGIHDPEVIAREIEKSMSQDILYLISTVAVIVCGVVFFFWYRQETRGEAMGSVRETLTVKNIILFILLGAGSQLFITGLMSISQQYFTDLFSDYMKQMERLTSGNVIVVLLLMALIAPVTEELIFRGVILHKACRAIPFWGANLLQAMLFGLYHMNIVQGIYAALLGLLLGFVCHKFKTVYASMFLHMVVNLSSIPVTLFPQNNVSYYIMVISGGISVFLSLFVIISKNKFQRENI